MSLTRIGDQQFNLPFIRRLLEGMRRDAWANDVREMAAVSLRLIDALLAERKQSQPTAEPGA